MGSDSSVLMFWTLKSLIKNSFQCYALHIGRESLRIGMSKLTDWVGQPYVLDVWILALKKPFILIRFARSVAFSFSPNGALKLTKWVHVRLSGGNY